MVKETSEVSARKNKNPNAIVRRVYSDLVRLSSMTDAWEIAGAIAFRILSHLGGVILGGSDEIAAVGQVVWGRPCNGIFVTSGETHTLISMKGARRPIIVSIVGVWRASSMQRKIEDERWSEGLPTSCKRWRIRRAIVAIMASRGSWAGLGRSNSSRPRGSSQGADAQELRYSHGAP